MINSDLILALLVVIVVMAVACGLFFQRQYLKAKLQAASNASTAGSGESTTDSLLGMDEQLKAQFQAVLLGQSVILEKDKYNACLEQGVQLQNTNAQNAELKEELQALTTEHNTLKAESQKREVELVQELSNIKGDKAHLQELYEALQEREQSLKTELQTTVEKLKSEHQATVDALKAEHQASLESLKTENTKAIEELKSENTKAIEELKSENTKAIEELKSESAKTIEELKSESAKALDEAKLEKDKALSALKQEKDETVAAAKKDKDEALAQAAEQSAAQLASCKQNYESTISELKASHEKLLQELKDAQKQELLAKQEHADKEIKELSATKAELTSKTEALSEELTQKNATIASLQSAKEGLEQLRAADAKRFEQAQNELEHRLNTMGEKLLKERGESLGKLNSEQMGQLIAPLRNELNTFRELITTTQKTNSEQAGQLQNELKHLQEAQISLTNQADQLSRALLQGSKSQGMWGEHQLERVLEMAGLENKSQFMREVVGVNSANEKGRIDVLIPLPRNHAIVVDAKCSLTAYTDLVNAELSSDKAAYEDALARHITSIKAHIDELSKKDYQSYGDFESPSFVFMFVPIDQALAVALKHEPTLYDYAQKKNIALLSPSLAVPALRIVSNLWVLADQGEKLKQVSAMAERIYQKSTKVCSDFEGILKARDSLNANIDKLNTSLYQGRGNLRQILSTFSQKAPRLTAEALSDLSLDSDAYAEGTAQSQKWQSSQPLLAKRERASRAALSAPAAAAADAAATSATADAASSTEAEPKSEALDLDVAAIMDQADLQQTASKLAMAAAAKATDAASTADADSTEDA